VVVSQPGTLVRGKIVVDASALVRSLDRSADAAVTWQQRDLSLCIPLALSRSVVFLLRLFHIPSRSLPLHPSRRDATLRRGRENGRSKEEGTNASEETHGREEKERERKRWRKGREEIKRQSEEEREREREKERWKMCTRFLQVRWIRSNSLLGRLRSYYSHSDDLSEMYSRYRAV